MRSGSNLDHRVVDGFGDEWTRFDQSALVGEDYERLFDSYFHIFPWESLSARAEGFDLGCGSGRWAWGVSPRVGTLHCIDASEAALAVARRNLESRGNVKFHLSSVDSIPLSQQSMDFGYCLGVLHHVPDTEAGLVNAVSLLKRGAPLLLYLYYAFDNRAKWYSLLWKASNLGRLVLSRSPHGVRYVASQIIAAAVYWPLARTANVLEVLGANVESFPLSAYRNQKFYSMRTDSLDRFGTRLEKRFTKNQMREMMERAGLRDITFSDRWPYWCAVGYRS